MKRHIRHLQLVILLLTFASATGMVRPTALFAASVRAVADTGIDSDDFNRCSPNTAPWQVVDPLGTLSLTTSGVGTNDAVMKMSIPGGETLSINDIEANAPRVMQPAADTDFEIEVKFDSGVNMNYQTQGILIAGAPGDFLRFDFHSRGKTTKRTYLYAGAISSSPSVTDTIKLIDPLKVFDSGTNPLWMRVKREGNTWTTTYSDDNFNTSNSSVLFKWPDESKYPGVPFAVTKAGIFVGTSGNPGSEPAHTAKVDYFFNNTSRLDPEDGPAFKANVSPEGAGTVTLPSPLGDAQCNQPISIEANPNTGFSFANWSGDATGVENPKPITFTGGQEVTANFNTATQYTLNASVAAGNGSVSKSPDQTQHDAGTSVDVMATADPGWLFAGWSGDVAAGQENQNPLTIAMDGDKRLTAHFVQTSADVKIAITGDGQVFVDGVKVQSGSLLLPLGETTLTLVRNDGWLVYKVIWRYSRTDPWTKVYGESEVELDVAPGLEVRVVFKEITPEPTQTPTRTVIPDDPKTATPTQTVIPEAANTATPTTVSLPIQGAQPLSGIQDIAAGMYHTCALTVDGSIKCWGSGEEGQLGDGTAVDRHVATNVNGLGEEMQFFTAGHSHTCAWNSNHIAKCWGDNDFGELGNGTEIDQYEPVPVIGLENMETIAGGNAHTCALMAGGTVKCWGSNDYGRLGDGTTIRRSMPLSDVVSLNDVQSITTSGLHTCALTDGGQVKCWGFNENGQIGDGTSLDRKVPSDVINLDNVQTVIGGGSHTCALMADRGVKCWGRNTYGQIGDGTTLDSLSPVDVIGLEKVKTVALGSNHTCALVDGGTVKCWGLNSWSGQLGDGTKINRSMPVDVIGLDHVTDIELGGHHSCALLQDSTVKCWGNNEYGQVGDGTTEDRHVPVHIVEELVLTRIFLPAIATK